jgi:hypothetical protein
MAKRVNSRHLGKSDTGARKLVVGKSAKGGREVWRISSNGRYVEVTTSGSSVRAMDAAVTKYGRALKRLADR